MNVSDLINSIKSLFFDFMGFFLPGFYALFLASATIEFNTSFYSVFRFDAIVLFILVCYVIGYIIYGFSEVVEKIKFIKSKKDVIILNVLSSPEVLIAKELLGNKLASSNINSALINNADFSTLRNIVMSFSPDSDFKVHTFRFRAEICRNISFVSLLFFLTLTIIFIVNVIFVRILNFSPLVMLTNIYLLSYLYMLISSLLLYVAYMRFLRISYQIPFSIFIAKIIS